MNVAPCNHTYTLLFPSVSAHLSSDLSQQESEKAPSQDPSPPAPPTKAAVPMLKCEVCQKQAPASTFNSSSKRFCSLSCSRRHNVSHTRRVGLFKPRGEVLTSVLVWYIFIQNGQTLYNYTWFWFFNATIFGHIFSLIKFYITYEITMCCGLCSSK